jgi:hypothetical protein
VLWLTAVALLVIALLYATVGHGGASGYLAVLALSGRPAEEVRATALILNVVVSSIALLRFTRTSGLRWRLLAPFAIGAVPLALLAGWKWSLSDSAYRIAVGLVLVLAAWRLTMIQEPPGLRVDRTQPQGPAWPVAVGFGAMIGVASGLIGVGGGIFLSPLLLLAGWANARETAAVSAGFILLSSLAGLTGLAIQFDGLPVRWEELLWFALAATIGGYIGSGLGAKRFSPILFRRALAVVLVFAAVKLATG